MILIELPSHARQRHRQHKRDIREQQKRRLIVPQRHFSLLSACSAFSCPASSLFRHLSAEPTLHAMQRERERIGSRVTTAAFTHARRPNRMKFIYRISVTVMRDSL
jgi:hypothetical protein